jgi:hypothetical protein
MKPSGSSVKTQDTAAHAYCWHNTQALLHIQWPTYCPCLGTGAVKDCRNSCGVLQTHTFRHETQQLYTFAGDTFCRHTASSRDPHEPHSLGRLALMKASVTYSTAETKLQGRFVDICQQHGSLVGCKDDQV